VRSCVPASGLVHKTGSSKQSIHIQRLMAGCLSAAPHLQCFTDLQRPSLAATDHPGWVSARRQAETVIEVASLKLSCCVRLAHGLAVNRPRSFFTFAMTVSFSNGRPAHLFTACSLPARRSPRYPGVDLAHGNLTL